MYKEPRLTHQLLLLLLLLLHGVHLGDDHAIRCQKQKKKHPALPLPGFTFTGSLLNAIVNPTIPPLYGP